MALIKCPNCQKDVSSMVTYCPFCNTDLTHVKASANESGDYYNSDAPFSYQRPDNWSASENHEDFPFQYPNTDELSSGNYRRRNLSDNSESRNLSGNYRTRNLSDDSKSHNSSGNYRTRNSSDSSGSRSSSGNSGRQAASEPVRMTSEPSPTRKSKRQAPPGRRLLGYRAGNPLHMLISVCYHMAACVGILYALTLSPQYLSNGTLIFHLCRVILAAAILFLPILLLSENKVRRKLPLLGSKKSSVMAIGFLLLYVPLAVLFSISWYFCL